MDTTGTLTVDLLLRQAVERSPDHTAIVDLATDDRYTYDALQNRVNSVARGLQELGVARGDRVAICLKNRPEHAVAFLATQEIGAVAVPFNFRLTSRGIEYTITDAEPRALVYGPAIRDAVADLHADLPLDQFVEVGDDPLPVAHEYASLADGPSTPPDVTVEPGDLSVIQYTSGTTGDPKGIPLDHTASMTRVLLDSLGQRYYLDECMLGAMPLYHTVGLHGILLPMIAVSGTFLSMPDFDPATGVRAIEREGVTAMHEAPTIFKRLLETDAIADADVSNVRAVAFSGAPMSPALMDEVLDVFDPAFISNQYGCTEAYAPLAQRYFDETTEPIPTGPANVLYSTRLVEMGLGDPSATVPTGEEGELIIHTDSPVAFDGYWNKPEETDAATVDGWFFTGDAAYETDDGGIVITGRVDHMIVSGGENIYPVEIEDLLEAHGDVADAAVIGVTDETWGEVPKAYVVPGDGLSEDHLDAFFRESDDLADFKRPRAYEFVDELPRNASGKLLRHELREMDDRAQ